LCNDSFAMGVLQRLRADLYLAYRASVAHPLKRLFSRVDSSGRERFLANFATEGLVPTSLEDRETILDSSRCIQCGLCDAYSVSTSAPPVSWLPLMTRSTVDIPHAKASLGKLDPMLLRTAEAICPTRVPLERIYDYARAKLTELEGYLDRSGTDSGRSPSRS
jgi:hypothetical protein